VTSIRLEAIHKVYPNGQLALRDVELSVAERELVVLVGPSGCGKSTALRLVAGLETPTRGRVWLGERDVTQLSPRERDVAMVFQSYALYPHKSVRENLAFGLRMRSVPRQEIARRTTRVAAQLGLEAVLERRPAELSGGQRHPAGSASAWRSVAPWCASPAPSSSTSRSPTSTRSSGWRRARSWRDSTARSASPCST
jgi:ABC-type sugar transport system ATPase subunit